MPNAAEHRFNQFTPVVACMNLADHVLKITDNVNKFPEFSVSEKKNPDGSTTQILVQRQDSLVNRVREQAWQIYILAWSANRINLEKEPWRKAERLGKQEKAISLCGEHLAAVQLCKRHFHLTSKKVKFWGEMTVKAQNYLAKWNDTDKDRYRNI